MNWINVIKKSHFFGNYVIKKINLIVCVIKLFYNKLYNEKASVAMKCWDGAYERDVKL